MSNGFYKAIPDFLAQEFLKNPTVEFGGQELTFYRVIRLDRAELMFWVPHPITLINREGEEERAYISFVLRFALQTVPGRKSPIVYHHLSVRRWIVDPLARPPYRGLTAYIGNELRLLDGVRQPLCFIRLTMKRRGEAQSYEGSFGSLWIKTQHIEDLTQNLDIDLSVPLRERQQRRVRLLQERVDRITSLLPPDEGMSGALIEIRQKAFPPEADPKLAWRIAAMQAGYLNQHIHALTYQQDGKEKTKKGASERVKRAVSELLRQCGILPDAPLIQPSDGIELTFG